MKIKFALRLLFFVILAFVHQFFGMDWTIIVAAVVIVADLDSIADLLRDKIKEKCQ